MFVISTFSMIESWFGWDETSHRNSFVELEDQN